MTNTFKYTLSLLFVLVMLPLHAWAQCAPGLPCTPDEGTYTAGDGTNAVKSDSDTCDADFMNQLHARAFMESEREANLAQTFVAKPDSVLEYTCFDEFVSIAAQNIGPLFTENDKWQSQTIDIGTTTPENIKLSVFMGDDRLDKSLENLVLKSLDTYIDSNFSHSFQGGNAAIDSSISKNIGDAAYDCAAMQQIWSVASCEAISTDAYQTFKQLSTADPRQKPLDCGGSKVTDNVIAVAENRDFAFSVFDPVDTFLERLNAPGSDPAKDCYDPIPTGLMAEIRTYTTGNLGETTLKRNFIPDSVCINPGCHYDLDSFSCKQ